jgi:hypothetical protein
MHGIHHSTRADEAGSNYSSLFSWWVGCTVAYDWRCRTRP